MIETKTTQLGQFHYQVKQLGSTAGRRMLVVLGKVLGPAIAEIFRGGKRLEDTTTDSLAAAIDSLVSVVDPDVLEREIIGPLEANTNFAPLDAPGRWVPVTADPSHWSGRYGDMLKWLKFALESNFATFFSLMPEIKAVSPAGTTEKA